MSTKTNLAIDLVIFSAFVAATNPALTGLPVHEWLSVAFIAALVTHIVLHWNWVISVSKTFLRKLFHSSRLNYVIDALLFVVMTVVMLSGLVISRSVLATLGISIAASPSWRFIHSLSANLTLVFTALHFALHWNWVVSSVKRYIISPITGMFSHPVSQPVQIQEND